eukprot:TRINITY_DN4483_c0_g1_i2.p1 TRINITY_DN4483_c0_g1~~TRINITY_DN4483_c0_g1_i2.p1  ORF type:complete len:130 (-),score=29.28 TRINITY_DN4483_c0_g1_i2:13-363(-)
MCPVMVNELYGEKYWGGNFAAICFSPGIGAYLLGTLLASHIYQSHIVVGKNCYGHECYRDTFRIIAGICAFGMLMSLALAFVTRKLYADLRKMNKMEANVTKSLNAEEHEHLLTGK